MYLYSTYLIIILFPVVCIAEKVTYLSTEHPQVTYVNSKYVSYANLTARRYGRQDLFYYVGLHFYSLYEFGNNVSAHYYFYEFLTNRYRRGFVEMHFKLCDLIEKDKFFGSPLKQGPFKLPCPYPAGEYHMYNMTVPLKNIPHNFPFRKGRIYCNMSATVTEEVIASGYIDMEIKQAHIGKKN